MPPTTRGRARGNTRIGVLVLIGAFALSLGFVLLRAARRSGADDRIVLRLAHHHNHPALERAYAAVIAAYEAAHPHVRVEQIAIPKRNWPAWQRVQLIGDNAPDVMLLSDAGTTDEILTRFYRPITDAIAQPNPYNAGTELADTPWRDTFLDGLASNLSFYREKQQQYYGVPTLLFTNRIYYNRALLRKITGGDRTPRTDREFLELCAQVRRHAEAAKTDLLPLAGTRDMTFSLFEPLESIRLQRLALRLDRDLDLMLTEADAAQAFLEKRWSLAEPEVRSALAGVRDFALQMQAGFLQQTRDEAVLYFSQQRALMFAGGSWEAVALVGECPFEIGVMNLPRPDHPGAPGEPVGATTEAANSASAAFGLPRGGRHPEQALDFLRFLTSQASNRTIAHLGQRTPSVAGVEPNELLRPFQPVDGFIKTFSVGHRNLGNFEVRRAYDVNLHLLAAPGGGVDAFLAALEKDYPRAMRADFEFVHANSRGDLRQSDLLLVASLRQLAPEAAARFAAGAFYREIDYHRSAPALGRAPLADAAWPSAARLDAASAPAPAPAAPAAGWEAVLQLDFSRAARAFGSARGPDAEFGAAVAELAAALRQPERLAAARTRLEEVARAEGTPALLARWLLARVAHLHSATPDLADARARYLHLADEHPHHFLGQQALLRALLLNLAGARGGDSATLAAAEAQAPRFTHEAVRRDYHILLAQYQLAAGDARAALRHWRAADPAQIALPSQRATALVVAARLAHRFGDNALAADYARRFEREFPRDPRQWTLRWLLAQAPAA